MVILELECVTEALINIEFMVNSGARDLRRGDVRFDVVFDVAA